MTQPDEKRVASSQANPAGGFRGVVKVSAHSLWKCEHSHGSENHAVLCALEASQHI